jgi:hypothetical protein
MRHERVVFETGVKANATFFVPRAFPRPQGKNSCYADLDLVHQHQDQHDDQNQAETAAGVVAPTSAVRPGGHSAEKQNDQHDEQDKSHLSPFNSRDNGESEAIRLAAQYESFRTPIPHTKMAPTWLSVQCLFGEKEQTQCQNVAARFSGIKRASSDSPAFAPPRSASPQRKLKRPGGAQPPRTLTTARSASPQRKLKRRNP